MQTISMVTDIETDMSLRGKEAIDDIRDIGHAKREILSMVGKGSDAGRLLIQESDLTSTCDGRSTDIECDDQEFRVMDLCQSVERLLEPAFDDLDQDMCGLIPQAMPAGVGQLVADGALSRSYQTPNPSRCANMGRMSRASNQECKRCGHQCESRAKFCINCGTKRDVTLGVTESVEWDGHSPTQVAIPAIVPPPPEYSAPTFWNIQSDSREPVPVYTHPGCAAPCAEVSQVPPVPAFNNLPSSLLDLAPFHSWANHQVSLDYPVGTNAPLKVCCQKAPFGHTPKPLDPTLPAKKKVPSWTESSMTSVLDGQALCRIHHQALASRYSPPNFDRDHQPCILQ
eukprot:gnl/MRDRNA2_/MRDRNA2_20303_c0_seq1.p1 gnl/MRDRNA2_/MRDRNA2_20303_c0~~gnl/MRDRNA2_/MRDRNA2_20303_c0_seq1.p1  ORF type:complete len:341 (-),score=32.27 gnl/MRDRNA2_/MRDRNA2_20303_c0_seq1:214-1236(-)